MDDGAAPALDHGFAERLGAQQVAGEVDGEQAVPVRQRNRGERSGKQHAGVVDQDVAGADCLRGKFGGGNAVGVGNVACKREGPGAGRAQHRFGGAAVFVVVVEQDDGGAGLGHAERDGAADAASGTGHHADTVL